MARQVSIVNARSGQVVPHADEAGDAGTGSIRFSRVAIIVEHDTGASPAGPYIIVMVEISKTGQSWTVSEGGFRGRITNTGGTTSDLYSNPASDSGHPYEGLTFRNSAEWFIIQSRSNNRTDLTSFGTSDPTAGNTGSVASAGRWALPANSSTFTPQYDDND